MSYEVFRKGLDAPICLTWEITYGCNLRCVHCLSSSGKRRRDELTTAEAKRLIDEWAEMKVFYINVGGGEPMSRRDFFELMDYALDRSIGVKFSTNGTLIDDAAAAWIASRDYLDVQISIDGATPETNDPVRGEGSYERARRAMDRLRKHGFRFKINATVTRPQLSGDRRSVRAGRPLRRGTAAHPAAPHRPRRRRLGRAAPDARAEPRPLRVAAELTATCSPAIRSSISRPTVEPMDGLNMCGAGRIVCCVDPVGEVYACPFTLAPEFSGRQRAPDRRVRRRVARCRRCSRTCATGRWAAAARRATPTTAATAAAWR